MTRVAALLRVSTPRQAAKHRADEETLPVQRAAVRRFVEARGWTLCREFAEEGVSAWKNSSEDRVILQEVLSAARADAFDVLVVFKYDRLSRLSLEYPALLYYLRRLGIRTWTVADDGSGRELTIESPMDKLLRFVEGWQAEMESTNTSIRVSATMRRMAEQGIWTGGRPPYGFRLKGGGRNRSGERLSLEIDAQEAEVVRDIFRMYLTEELGSPAIARRLNAAGRRLRNGKEWHDSAVREVLKNPTVAGRPAYGRHYRDKGTGTWRHRPAGSPEIVIAPATIPEWEIIPWETWQAAQARLAAWRPSGRGAVEDRTRTKSESGPLLLTGLLRCAYCGGPITAGYAAPVKVLKDGTKVRYRYPRYVDRNHYGGQTCPGQRTYSVRQLDRAVLQAIRAVLEGLDQQQVYQRVRQRVVAGGFQHQQRAQLVERQVAQAERLVKEWTDRLNQFLVDPASSRYTEDFLADRVREADAALKAARSEQARLVQAGAGLDAQLAALERFQAIAPTFWKDFLRWDRPQQKRTLRHLLEKVVVSRTDIVLHWRLDLAALLDDSAANPGVITWRDEIMLRA
jgi:site-specific DNA recombinase